ncbi:GH3 family domain-containing protein [Alkalithermobacter paradoxus]|uniref:GH3 auxin-responsive promoter n=1 Tax=Alkalithermobacter paradoxus TaxID=29349 RepID=A0A1V4I6X6_9FIRM|nr:GH3 auxin-responsive promoter [[Clostridium] thermoalcaliphilum]
MPTFKEMFREGKRDEIWEKYCGFLDLNIDEFMKIQERLLMEQIELLSSCELGKMLMGNIKPKSIDEFRELIPLTTYDDYADTLLNKKEELLPQKPMYWIKTTWKGGEHPVKLAPYSESMVKEHAKAFIASLILCTSKKRGDFKLAENDKFLYGMAPLPYLTGLAPYGLKEKITFDYLPTIEEAESMGFKERNEKGFELGLRKGIDIFFGLSSVLVKIGESFSNEDKNGKSKMVIPSNFGMAYRLVNALIKKKLLKKTILPRDIWSMKGIICAGTDSSVFKEKIEYYWGIKPIEIYGGTEIAIAATETWSKDGLTFFPDVNFLEFIPEKYAIRDSNQKKLKTLLLNEIKAGERYELVITKFKGGAFIRYRVGDIIECISLDDKKNGINIPQIKFVDRVSNIIDIAGFTRITKDTINNAINNSSLNVNNWVARKEYIQNEPKLHIYLEMNETVPEDYVKEKLNMSLKKLDSDFESIDSLLGKDPLHITILRKGTFSKFEKMKNIALNPINPSADEIQMLISISNE